MTIQRSRNQSPRLLPTYINDLTECDAPLVSNNQAHVTHMLSGNIRSNLGLLDAQSFLRDLLEQRVFWCHLELFKHACALKGVTHRVADNYDDFSMLLFEIFTKTFAPVCSIDTIHSLPDFLFLPPITSLWTAVDELTRREMPWQIESPPPSWDRLLSSIPLLEELVGNSPCVLILENILERLVLSSGVRILWLKFFSVRIRTAASSVLDFKVFGSSFVLLLLWRIPGAISGTL